MKKITTTFGILCFAGISSYAGTTIQPLKKIDNSKVIKQKTVRAETVLYKLKPNATQAQLKKFNALITSANLLEKKEIRGTKVQFNRIKGIKGKEQSFAEQLKATGAVSFAEPDVLIEHQQVPNDAYYSSQWHHKTIGSPTAWDTTTGSSSVKVCVVDTGVDTDHPDLVNNLLLPGYNAYLRTSGNVEDLYGHGTGTAGVIAAQGNNSNGVAGVNWNVKIMPVQVSQGSLTSSAYISDMANGIEWCADNGAKVVNLSYGGIQYETINNAATYLRNKGGLLFMSAGNAGTYHDAVSFPDYPNFVGVGSTSQSDVLSTFSEYGPYIDIAAPGENIVTTYLNGQYVYYSGTSFSSPMAAGVAALLLSVNPNLTPSQLENYIFSTADDLGDAGQDDKYGYGRINVAKAVAAVKADMGTPINASPISVAKSDKTTGQTPLVVTFDGRNSTDSDGTIVKYSWNFGDGNISDLAYVQNTYTTAGTYNATLTVEDDMGATSQSNVVITVTEPVNNPPIVKAFADKVSGTIPVTVTFDGTSSSDIDGNIVSYLWNFGDETTSTSAFVQHTYTSAGIYNATLTVTDDDNAVTKSSNITITATSPIVTTIDTPTNLTSSVNGTTATLKWSHSMQKYTMFDLYRADNINGTFVYNLISSIATNSYSDKGLSSGEHKYKVIARNTYSNVSSDFSNEATVTVKGTTSKKTPKLRASLSGKKVTLSVDYSCSPKTICLYQVQKTLVNSSSYNFLSTSNSKNRVFVESKGSWQYKVRVFENSSYSDWSAPVVLNIK